jgi:nitroimidazol reductase NimA-like FMN-containing flavoprotein (pyridoxamine 5'-phosphate oxidase superfamily)
MTDASESGEVAASREIALSRHQRRQAEMKPEEVTAFLHESRLVTCCTIGARGWPHVVPLLYVLRPTGANGSLELWAATYARSQKARNLARDPRATLQIESGKSYFEFRGVMLECDVVVHKDIDLVAGLLVETATRHSKESERETALARVLPQAPKRIAMQFRECLRATWDHRKLVPSTAQGSGARCPSA